jgi:site-specific DNA-methyltransferase (adenine-specific)
VCAIEDAGFEVRDQIGWMYAVGFPKSLDVSKAIDKAAGAEREVVGYNAEAAAKANKRASGEMHNRYGGGINDNGATITAPATPEAQQWAGWGTALKPAWEPICVARKPLSEGTVAANVLAHGVGAINIDGCRVASSAEDKAQMDAEASKNPIGNTAINIPFVAGGGICSPANALGRWPANVIHDGSDEVLAAFAQFGESKRKASSRGDGIGKPFDTVRGHTDTGTAARFFYSAKASKADRADSKHPTVKPLSLMRHLCKLVTPPGGTVLDMFAGSGTTLQAAVEEGFNAIGIEREDEYVADIKRRLGLEDDTEAFIAELLS